MTRAAKRRGKDWEREVSMLFREWGYPDATRTPNSGGLAEYPGDVMNVGPFLIECKADQTISVWAALRQAVSGADRAGDGPMPLVFMRRRVAAGKPNERCVAMPIWVFAELLKNYRGGN